MTATENEHTAREKLVIVPCFQRYQFFLQLKRDVLHGKLPCPFEVAVQLAGFALQCEYGLRFASSGLYGLLGIRHYRTIVRNSTIIHALNLKLIVMLSNVLVIVKQSPKF